MGYFPLYVDISNKNCVVVGGGNTAARKIEKLALFNAKITVIAPKISDEILKIKNIKILKREFEDSDLNGAFIVIGATDNKNLNSKISQICRQKNIPVNIVDDPKNCSFYFPSIVRKNNITVAVSTDGEVPLIARFLREKIEKIIEEFFERCQLGKTPENIGDFVQEMRDKFDNSDRDEEEPSGSCADSNGLQCAEK